MQETQIQRKTQQSTTCFLECEGKYLFIHRNKKGNSSDFGLWNGVGGKLESGEDFLSCAIREVKEETGFIVSAQDTRLSAVVSLSGGYPEDWVMCFFMIKVPSLTIPSGVENDEGSLFWLDAEQVLSGKFSLVADLQYLWEDMLMPNQVIFFAAQLSETKQIKTFQKTSLPLSRPFQQKTVQTPTTLPLQTSTVLGKNSA